MQGPLLDAAEVLTVADAVMRARQPTFSAGFRHGPYSLHARWDYPGTLAVYFRDTGRLVARSVVGKPTTPDLKANASK